jgi:GxxExxY protein
VQDHVRERFETTKADAESAEGTEQRRTSRRGELLHHQTTGVILGAFFATHSELGFGFLEAVYANSLAILLTHAGLLVQREVPFAVTFHGHQVGLYRADILVESRVLVEVKTGNVIIPQHASQLLNYLRAARLQVGLLLNYGPRASFKRVINTTGTQQDRGTADAEDAGSTELQGDRE